MTPKKQPVSSTPLRIDWLSDADIAALQARPEQCRFLFGHPALLLELQNLMQTNPSEAHWYRPACVYPQDNAVAAGGFKGPPINGTVELGYRTHPDWRRQGYATELVRWLCAAAQREGLTRVVAVTATGNLASQAVLAQTGFVHTGDFLSDSQQWLQRWQHTL
ncbi:GNAT family N-acetyltransferase [Saccharospirillum alexandrii]|uniref:GNAT family N-acetyltransferase n=1 Tax=Saccharospirillum alexandrii TaxID=2448477 RepID=UPI000FD91D7A|nr:GNAT family N-acetyltransferase [Saccharospirillum alexandrii]